MRLILSVLFAFQFLLSCGQQRVRVNGEADAPTIISTVKQEKRATGVPDIDSGSETASTVFSIGDESDVDKRDSQYRLSVEVASKFIEKHNLEEEAFYKTGTLIFNNETGGSIGNLVFFSPKESFPSLGINHFIWICPNHPKYSAFGSSFTNLLYFLKEKGFQIPSFIKDFNCTWKHRSEEDFANDAIAQQQAKELHSFLSHTRAAQAVFSFKRFSDALPKILAGAGVQRAQFESKINGVQNSSAGYFPLVDYINFKGEGVFSLSNKDSYGLFQVLQEMKPSGDPLVEFAEAGIRTLKTRRSAPDWKKSGEGWTKRLERYKTLSLSY